MASGKKQTTSHKNLYLLGVLVVAILALIIAGIKVLKHSVISTIPSQMPLNNAIISMQQSVNNNDIKDWKTYTDPKYHFTVQYPPTWNIGKAKTFTDSQMNLPVFMNNNYGISFTINNPTNANLAPLFINIVVNENPQKWSIAKWVNTIEKNSGGSLQNQKENILVDNQSAISGRQNPDFKDVYINYISKNTENNTIYSLSFGGNGEGAGDYQDTDLFVEKGLADFQTLLSSIKFSN